MLLRDRSDRFVENRKTLLDDDGYVMPEAKISDYPTHIREVFKLL